MTPSQGRASAGEGVRQLLPRVLMCVGMAMAFCSIYSSRLRAEAFDGVALNAMLFSEFFNLAAFLACTLLYRQIDRVGRASPHRLETMMVALGLLASVGRELANLAHSVALPAWVPIAGVALYSFAEPGLVLGFVVSGCRHELLSLKFIVPGALALCGLPMLLLLVAPAAVGDALVTSFPLLSALLFAGWKVSYAAYCLECGHNDGGLREALHDSAGEETETPAPARPRDAGLSPADAASAGTAPDDPAPAGPADAAPGNRQKSLPLWPFVLMFVYDFIFHAITYLGISSQESGVAGMIAVAAAALGVATVATRHDSYSPLMLNMVAMPLAVAGLMSLVAAQAWPAGSTALLSNAGSSSFYMFLIITFAMLCQRREYNATRSFALLMSVEHVAHITGTLAGAFIGSPEQEGAMLTWVAGMTVALVALTSVFADEPEVMRLFGLVPQGLSAPVRGVAAGMPVHGAGEDAVTLTPQERAAWESSVAARRYGLTIREEQVYELMLSGLGNAEIAERLVVSTGTVKTHVSHICRKLDVGSRDEALNKDTSL